MATAAAASSATRHHPARWAPPAAMALLSLLAAAWLQLQPLPQGPLALVFPPWWSATRAILAAAPAGAIIRLGAFPFIVIIQPSPPGGLLPGATGALSPGATGALSPGATGAWAILNPQALGACAGNAAPETIHGR